jgi:hypothetical protein
MIASAINDDPVGVYGAKTRTGSSKVSPRNKMCMLIS